MIPRIAKLGTGFVGAGMYYMHDKREDAAEAKRPTAAEYFLSDKGPAQTAERVGFTATRNCTGSDPMAALRQMAFTAAHAHEIRVAAVTAAARAAGMSYDAYVKAANPFRGRKGTKPVYSLSLSFPPGDPHATKANMLKAADEVRGVLGLGEHQCLIVEHTDTKHPHVHLIINRVHPRTGKFASLANDRLKLSDWALDWERRHGKVVCPAREPNRETRRDNAEVKRTARARGEPVKATGYVKNTGLPPSEIAFWNEHGSANLADVRAARAERQRRDYEQHKRVTARKFADIDLNHERANGKTLARIERTLKVLKGEAVIAKAGREKRPASLLDVMFGAVRGALHGIVARIANRTDIAKLERIKTEIRKERDIRRAETITERKRAFKKMERIHAWQNWLDEKRCKTYRDSDTRDWRARRDRWDMGKLKPPLFGTVISARYDIEEARDWRQAADDRRKMNEPIEMKPIPWGAAKSPEGPGTAARTTENRLPFVKRDPEQHARDVAERAKAKMAERAERERNRGKTGARTGGRKRRPRPR